MSDSSFDYNRDCRCVTVDPDLLRRELTAAGLGEPAAAQVEKMFSRVDVHVSRAQLEQMQQVARDVETVVELAAYREHVLASAPPIARLSPGNWGVLFSYDFHLGGGAPQVIEINSNAGGALLNVFLARAQKPCCPEARVVPSTPDLAAMEQKLFAMFEEEWRAVRRDGAPLRSVAIVDDAPATQFLHPEFVAFAKVFGERGVRAVIADPRELTFTGGALTHEGQPIDLVYNRLTDFYLDDGAHAHLRAAYESNAVVLTPHPRGHALFANKRNLVHLTDEALLASLGVPSEARERLARAIPKTIIVDKAEAESLWRERKRWFFKPVSGYGSKAAYRGDKLTKGTFAELIERDYVAQAVVAPSERLVDLPSGQVSLKLDVRAFTYRGRTLSFASRLYTGQTTNFRTEGGGFAAVVTSGR